MVGSSGVEPPTSCLSGMRSNLLSYEPLLFSTTKIDLRSLFQFLMNHVFGFATDGGDEGNRTLDPLLAGQVLSQLSYTPIMGYFFQPLSVKKVSIKTCFDCRSLEIEQQLVEANRVYVVLFFVSL